MNSSVRLSRCLAGIGFVVCAMLLAGCSSGPKRYGVSGTVKYKGEPIKAGIINFRSSEGMTGSATITNGEYSMPAETGLVPGNYKVSISYPDPKTLPKEGKIPSGPSAVKELLPPKYNTKTTLTADIEAKPMNEKDFDLK